nr:class I SAM-dependent RNA methyltransferase [Bifidobacterium choloepi]
MTIERYADQGRCVGHIDGRVVFVRFALPGERVRVRLDEPANREDRFWTGEVVDVLEPSPDRLAEPAWPLAGPLAMGGGVGGADLVHVSLPGQLAWKSATITDQMKRLGHVDATLPAVPVERIAGDEALDGLHWRTRIEMIADDNGHPSMRRRGTHVRVPLDTMPLATKAVLAVATANGIWDTVHFEPGAQIRIAVPEPRDLDTSALDLANPDDVQRILAAVGDNYAILVDGQLFAGSDDLTEHVTVDGHDFAYGVAASGFWQIHRQAPQVLPAYVLSLVRGQLERIGRTDRPVIWDLYSGSGLFTLPLATLAGEHARVFTVEGAKAAVHHARHNAYDAGLDNVESFCGDVARTLAHHVPRPFAHPDVVVLDPPRAGAKARVCRQIADSGARAVVYIACDPTSLARDTATLTHDLDFRLADVRAFDIYPNTHHVETVALFVR